MFFVDEVRLSVSLPVAQARLANLTLISASDHAYREGVTSLARVGPQGSVLGLPRVVTVSCTDLVTDAERSVLGLRWEAAGQGGSLFPALDADITLTGDGDEAAWLRLGGVYRLPLGPLSAGLDPAVIKRTAAATIRSFVTRVADAIAYPAGTPEREQLSPSAEPSSLPPAPEMS
jgi:hypothetical protein